MFSDRELTTSQRVYYRAIESDTKLYFLLNINHSPYYLYLFVLEKHMFKTANITLSHNIKT